MTIYRFSELSRRSSPSPARTGRRLETVLIDLAVKRAAADVQDLRRFELVPLGGLQDADDVRPLGVSQRWQARGRLFGAWHRVAMQELDIRGADGSAGRGERSARHGAFQLADIARPVIRGQQVLRLGRELLGVER